MVHSLNATTRKQELQLDKPKMGHKRIHRHKIVVTYIELVALYNLGWRVVNVVVGLVVLVPFKTLQQPESDG